MHTTQLIARQGERTMATMRDKLSTMTSLDLTSVWNTTETAMSQEGNRTQEEINHLLEVMNRAMFTRLLPLVAFLVVLIVVGVFGNLLVFLVYLKQFKASATRVFVLAMAVCDFLTNVFALPWLIQDLRYTYTSQKHFCIVKGFLGTFPVIMSFLILVLVALDRRHRICQPMKLQLSSRKAACLMIFPLILTSAIVLPFSILYGVRPMETSVSGVTGTTCEYPNTDFGKKVKGALGMVLGTFFVVGFALLIICYAQISHRIYQQNKTVLLQRTHKC
ncbi:orexin receptor type 2-like isoform X2 [Pomacea canaliculata]|uniref:orexin receptor type 2-like isoform X2 n=1 Tax=Pomacea canaliculata TaxID=400727 RepID=UPI000D731949|nr:orexin receptor type 2-like isoform X2 [Pomacea canaliculata]